MSVVILRAPGQLVFRLLDNSVSVSHLAVEVLRLQMCATTSGPLHRFED